MSHVLYITHKKGEIIDIKAVIIDDLRTEADNDIYFDEQEIKYFESNRLVKKAADEMNIDTFTMNSKWAEDFSFPFILSNHPRKDLILYARKKFKTEHTPILGPSPY